MAKKITMKGDCYAINLMWVTSWNRIIHIWLKEKTQIALHHRHHIVNVGFSLLVCAFVANKSVSPYGFRNNRLFPLYGGTGTKYRNP